MKTILQVSDPNVYAQHVNAPVLHPLVSVIHYGTDLEPRMKDYRFFSYFATETLVMETSEWGRITQLAYSARYLGDVVHKGIGVTFPYYAL